MDIVTYALVKKAVGDLDIDIQKQIHEAVDKLIDEAPGTLDTLKEIAESLGNDEDFIGTMKDELAKKVDKETGKGLSQEDFTTDLKNELEKLLKTQDNWMENNPDNRSYIKGRTHWNNSTLKPIEYNGDKSNKDELDVVPRPLNTTPDEDNVVYTPSWVKITDSISTISSLTSVDNWYIHLRLEDIKFSTEEVKYRDSSAGCTFINKTDKNKQSYKISKINEKERPYAIIIEQPNVEIDFTEYDIDGVSEEPVIFYKTGLYFIDYDITDEAEDYRLHQYVSSLENLNDVVSLPYPYMSREVRDMYKNIYDPETLKLKDTVLSESLADIDEKLEGKADASQLEKLKTQLEEKASSTDIEGLRTELEGKADSADIEDFQNQLDSKADSSALEELQNQLEEKADKSALTDFLTSDDLTGYIQDTDLTNYVTKNELNSYATNEELNDYATKTELNTKANQTELEKYTTKEEASTTYATKTELNTTYATKTEVSSTYATKIELETKADKTALNGKVDKEEGKVLSSNDFTTEYKTKIDNLATKTPDLAINDPTSENYVFGRTHWNRYNEPVRWDGNISDEGSVIATDNKGIKYTWKKYNGKFNWDDWKDAIVDITCSITGEGYTNYYGKETTRFLTIENEEDQTDKFSTLLDFDTYDEEYLSGDSRINCIPLVLYFYQTTIINPNTDFELSTHGITFKEETLSFGEGLYLIEIVSSENDNVLRKYQITEMTNLNSTCPLSTEYLPILVTDTVKDFYRKVYDSRTSKLKETVLPDSILGGTSYDDTALQAKITSLETQLESKAETIHSHTINQITDLNTQLSAKQDKITFSPKITNFENFGTIGSEFTSDSTHAYLYEYSFFPHYLLGTITGNIQPLSEITANTPHTLIAGCHITAGNTILWSNFNHMFMTIYDDTTFFDCSAHGATIDDDYNIELDDIVFSSPQTLSTSKKYKFRLTLLFDGYSELPASS